MAARRTSLDNARRAVMLYGAEVRMLRRAADISLRCLAEEVAIGWVDLSRIERGLMVPTPAQEDRLSRWMAQARRSR